MNKKQKGKIDKGFSSLDLVATLGLSVLIIIGVLGAIYLAYRNVSGSSDFMDITQLQTQTRALLKTSNGYDFASPEEMTGALIQFNGIPSGLTIVGDKSSGNAKLANNWGGSVTLQPITVSDLEKAGFSITYNNMPSDICVKVATKLSQTFDSITINGNNNVGTTSPAKIGQECTGDTGDTGNNVLIFNSNS